MLVRCNKTSIVAELEVGGTFGWKDTHSNFLLVYRIYSLLIATLFSLFTSISFKACHNCGIYSPFMTYPDSEETLIQEKYLESGVCSHYRSREVQTLPSCIWDGTADVKTVVVKAQRMGQHHFISGWNLTVISIISLDSDLRQCKTDRQLQCEHTEKIHGLRMSPMNGDTICWKPNHTPHSSYAHLLRRIEVHTCTWIYSPLPIQYKKYTFTYCDALLGREM